MTPHPAILIVDDERHLRLSLSLILQKENYRVDAAASAEEALDCLKVQDYDLMFLDPRPLAALLELTAHHAARPRAARRARRRGDL